MVHGTYATTCDTGGRTSSRSIQPVRSFWCHIWAVSRNSRPAYYQLRMLPMYGAVSHCAYWKCSTASKLMSMPGYSPIANFFSTSREIPSRPYTCTSYHTFRSSFGRTAEFKIMPIRHWGGETHSNLSVLMAKFCCSLWSQGRSQLLGTWKNIIPRGATTTRITTRLSVHI